MAGSPHLSQRGTRLFILAVLSLLGACGQPQTQLPDLSLRVSCNAQTARAIEPEIEEFLRAHRFKVLNLAALRRGRSIAAPWPLEIEGLDDHDRLVRVISHDISPDEQSLAFYSPPPTRHDDALEQSLTSFFEAKCAPVAAERHSNDSSAAGVHEAHVRALKQRLTEAEMT